MDAAKAAETAHVLRKTFDHANGVMQRVAVDANTPRQRVGIFKTSYRREAIGHDVADLTSRHLWSDIGVANGGNVGDLQAILTRAASLQPEDDNLLADNHNLRVAAHQDIRQLNLIVADLEKLNAAEEVVLNKMLAIS